MSGLRVVAPTDLHEAERLLADERRSRYVAGGTALQLEWAKGEKPPRLLVDLARLRELHGIAADGDELRIGAATRLDRLDLARHDTLLGSGAASIEATAAVIAAPSIRRLATIGGNIAGRTGCLIPTLAALDAAIVHFARGVERRTGLLDWLVLPTPARGILVAVVLPKARAGQQCFIRKIGLRTAFTPSIIGIAGMVWLGEGGRIAEVRLAVGGGIVKPQRLLRAEAKLIGRSIGELAADLTLKEALGDEIDAPSDDLRSARYRKCAAANAIFTGLISIGAVSSAGRPFLSLAASEGEPGRGNQDWEGLLSTRSHRMESGFPSRPSPQGWRRRKEAKSSHAPRWLNAGGGGLTSRRRSTARSAI